MSAMRSLILLMAAVLVCKCIASKASQLVSVQRDDVDGERLIKLGQSFNNSMLKLVGNAFENLEEAVVHKLCKKNPCTLWTHWTNCTANGIKAFGYQTRLRKCWYNSTDACAQDGTVTIETASKVCEGQCKSDYTITKHGFCLKFRATRVDHLQAEKICQSEGGYMINVDTKERLIDFTAIANTTLFILVDGTRTNVNARFSYRVGGDPVANGVVKWRKGQPGNEAKQFCIATRLINGTIYWFDAYCSFEGAFVCEIR